MKYNNNLVCNGEFAFDGYWTKSAQWSISGGVATCIANGATQIIYQDCSPALVVGNWYKIQYEVTANSLVGYTDIALATNSVFGYKVIEGAVGTHTYYYEATNSGHSYDLGIGIVTASTSGSISIDNIRVEQVLVENGGFNDDSEWIKNAQWSIAGGVATCVANAGYNRIYQADCGLGIGKLYKVSYEVVSNTLSGGTVAIQAASIFGYHIISTSVGVYTYYLEAVNEASTYDIGIALHSNVLSGTLVIDNVEIQECIPITRLSPLGLSMRDYDYDNFEDKELASVAVYGAGWLHLRTRDRYDYPSAVNFYRSGYGG